MLLRTIHLSCYHLISFSHHWLNLWRTYSYAGTIKGAFLVTLLLVQVTMLKDDFKKLPRVSLSPFMRALYALRKFLLFLSKHFLCSINCCIKILLRILSFVNDFLTLFLIFFCESDLLMIIISLSWIFSKEYW